MTSTTSIYELAGEAYDAFRASDPDKGERADIILLRDDAPEWVRQLVQSAHAEFFPDDWRYASIRSALGDIHDAEPDDLDDYGHEWADSNVDIYTGSRLQWLASNLNRAAYVDDARSEMAGDDLGIVEQIGLGQYMESSVVYASVVASLLERAAELEA